MDKWLWGPVLAQFLVFFTLHQAVEGKVQNLVSEIMKMGHEVHYNMHV